MKYYCYQVSEDEASDLWGRIKRGRNLMAVYIPWLIHIGQEYAIESSESLPTTMHHWSEFIAFLTRKKLEGKYHEY